MCLLLQMDELSESKRNDDSFLCKLIFGELYKFVSVALTSRPSASTSIVDNFDRFVEIHGFNKGSIVEYIESEFADDHDKACRLLGQLDDNPLIESACSVPLNCAIVCHLWHTLEETLPTTMTELYTKIVLNVVLHNIQKKKAFKGVISLSSFESLPEELIGPWWLLCEFALQAIERDQIVFSQEELVQIFPQGLSLDESILCFGLLQSTESVISVGCSLSFHFLHLTFQEYLAALHLVRQPVKGLELLETHSKSESFDIVSRFFFGIYGSKLEDKNCQVVEPYIARMDSLDKQLLLYQCAFEAQNEVVNTKIFQCLKGFTLETEDGHPSSAYDCSAVIYFISSVPESHDVSIFFGNCGVRDNQIRTLAKALSNKHRNLRVIALNLSGNNLSDKSVSELFNGASPAFQSLWRLYLSGNNIGPESLMSIRTCLANLSHLALSDNPCGVSSLQVLEEAVCSGLLPKLSCLYLRRSLTDDRDINDALLTTLLIALSDHCPELWRLSLSHNSIGISGASALGRIISHRKNLVSWRYSNLPETLSEQLWLYEIDLDNTIIGDEALMAFVNSLEGPCHLSRLNLRSNNIYSIEDSGLIDAICSGKIALQHILKAKTYCRFELLLDDNPLSLQGVVDISRIFSSEYCNLTLLSLSRCQLTTVGDLSRENYLKCRDVGQTLIAMPCSHTVRTLILDSNCFSGESIHVLAGFMHLCPRLSGLYSRNCEITSNDLRQLLVELKSSSSFCDDLHKWDLQYNRIDDSGLSALLDCQSSLFPSLEYNINIDYNPVSCRMKKRMEKEREEEEQRRIEERRRKDKEEGIECLESTFSFGELSFKINGKEVDVETFARRVQFISAPKEKKVEIMWKDVVSNLLQAALDIVACHPSVSFEVVGEDKNALSLSPSSNSCQGDSLALPEELQRQWKFVVSNLYQSAMEFLVNHTVHLEVIHEEERGTPPHIQNTIDREASRTNDRGLLRERSGDSGSSMQGNCSNSKTNLVASGENVPVKDMHHIVMVTDLPLIQTLLWEGRAKWYNIGLQLGLSPGTLDAIEQTHHHHTDRCFTATLNEWLTTPKLDRSWNKLAKCLNKKTVGLGELAEQLKLNFGPKNDQ